MREFTAPDAQRVGHVGEQWCAARRVAGKRALELRTRGSERRRAACRQEGRAEGTEGVAAGASSSTTCALVPPKPNELTPARRSPAPAGAAHGVSVFCTRKGEPAKSMDGFGASKPIEGGNVRRESASDALIKLAAPAAMTRCPTLLFSEPMEQKPRSEVWRRNARVSPSISMGSPSGVAVPCASTYEMLRASTPAASCAAAMTAA